MEQVTIRPETSDDVAAVRDVNRAAFGTTVEADLVDALRGQVRTAVSLVADDNATVIGHLMLSPVTLAGHPELRLLGLAPMAVIPDRQKQGVGSALVHEAIARARARCADAIVVLGHADYYPRFGFVPASRFGLRSTYDVADDVFLILQLEHAALEGKSGTIEYHAAFAEVPAGE